MNNDNNNHHPWDARTYDKVSSNAQLEWGRNLLDKRRWIVTEIVPATAFYKAEEFHQKYYQKRGGGSCYF